MHAIRTEGGCTQSEYSSGTVRTRYSLIIQDDISLYGLDIVDVCFLCMTYIVKCIFNCASFDVHPHHLKLVWGNSSILNAMSATDGMEYANLRASLKGNATAENIGGSEQK